MVLFLIIHKLQWLLISPPAPPMPFQSISSTFLLSLTPELDSHPPPKPNCCPEKAQQELNHNTMKAQSPASKSLNTTNEISIAGRRELKCRQARGKTQQSESSIATLHESSIPI